MPGLYSDKATMLQQRSLCSTNIPLTSTGDKGRTRRLNKNWLQQTSTQHMYTRVHIGMDALIYTQENNKNFLQKWSIRRDGIINTETSCHTAEQYLAVGHTCKGVAPYPYIWQHQSSWWQKERQSNYIKRNDIVLLASAFYRSSTFFTTTALYTIRTAIASQGMMHVLPVCISQSCNYSRVKVTVR